MNNNFSVLQVDPIGEISRIKMGILPLSKVIAPYNFAAIINFFPG
jgi:hypothetical protein